MNRQSRHGFTLIELLIVVAIIGILAAIAVPNFLNAQTRAKVARVQSDHRALGTALSSYQIDNNGYPWPKFNGRFETANHVGNLLELTTPVSYIGSVDLDDPFVDRSFWQSYGQSGVHPMYVYVNYHGSWGTGYYPNDVVRMSPGYGMTSHGPDKKDSGGVHWPVWVVLQGKSIHVANALIYTSSNGLTSNGDIIRFGGGVRGPGDGGG